MTKSVTIQTPLIENVNLVTNLVKLVMVELKLTVLIVKKEITYSPKDTPKLVSTHVQKTTSPMP